MCNFVVNPYVVAYIYLHYCILTLQFEPSSGWRGPRHGLGTFRANVEH